MEILDEATSGCFLFMDMTDSERMAVFNAMTHTPVKVRNFVSVLASKGRHLHMLHQSIASRAYASLTN